MNNPYLMERPAGNSTIRLIHAAPQAANVDVYVNENKIVKNFSFKQISSYFTLPPGKYQIDVYPEGNMTEAVISKKIEAVDGKSYTLAVIEGEKHLRLISYLNEAMVPHNETKIRFIHLSPDAPAVDIAVPNGDVVFENVSYKQATNYLALTPMTIDLEARVTSTKQIALSLPKLKFRPNVAYSIIAVGYAKEKPELETLIIKD
ncbi:MAG: DUF4397 domain-containing protein [Bacillota bacterium]|nr:DUF4397 domain-containing protein [Bacillota bacterium]